MHYSIVVYTMYIIYALNTFHHSMAYLWFTYNSYCYTIITFKIYSIKEECIRFIIYVLPVKRKYINIL